jgi:hypothetical protein
VTHTLFEAEEMPASEYPLTYSAIAFSPPGILVDRPADVPAEAKQWVKYTPDILERFAPNDGDTIGIALVDPISFGQLLAKIAHCYAVAEFGADLAPALVPFILNRETPGIHWLGGDLDYPPATPQMHDIKWRIVEHHGESLVVIDLRLFAFLGSPQYRLVAGHFTGSIDKLPFLEQPLYTIDVKQPPSAGEPIPPGIVVWDTGL